MSRESLALLWFVLITSFHTSLQAQEIDAQRQKKVDALFAEWDRAGSPGCALGIVREGELIYAAGYGMADLEHELPITPETVFYVGSVSKQFVAASTLLLAEAGRLSLDDPVQKYIPELPQYDHPITVRHLIHHTSGIRSYLELGGMAGIDWFDYVPPEQILKLVCRQEGLNFRPGTQYLYNNSGYFLLALIVERVSEQSFGAFTRANIFEPLSMTSAHFHSDPFHLVANRAWSYSMGEDGNIVFNLSRFSAVGSGGLYASIRDLYRWDQNFYDNQLGEQRQSFIDTMLTNGRFNDGSAVDYAFALVNATYRGLPTVQHSGSFAGYRAQLMRFPEQEFSVILLANLGSMNPTALARRVAEIFLEDAMEAPTEGEAGGGEKETPRPFDMDPSRMASFAGRYYSEELDARYHLKFTGRELHCQVQEQAPFKLQPMNRSRFRGNGWTFRFDGDGQGFTLDGSRAMGIGFVRR